MLRHRLGVRRDNSRPAAGLRSRSHTDEQVANADSEESKVRAASSPRRRSKKEPTVECMCTATPDQVGAEFVAVHTESHRDGMRVDHVIVNVHAVLD